MSPVYTVDLSPRENVHVRPSPWWWIVEVLALGIVVYFDLVMLMVLR